jgi:hypothetical protein
MYRGKFVFSQIMDHVVRYQFNQCVVRYHGEYWVKNFTCWEQFLAMAFGQLARRESLRDIVVCLNAHHEKLYHFGFRSPLVRTTLAYANERRDWRISSCSSRKPGNSMRVISRSTSIWTAPPTSSIPPPLNCA